MKRLADIDLLSTNKKLEKSLGQGEIAVTGLALAPHRRYGGENVCDEAGFCSTVCNLWFSGRTVTKPVRNAMMRRSELLFTDRVLFESKLRIELDKFQAKADRAGKHAYARLNVSSDLDWSHIIRDYPLIRFYDYTKIRRRVDSLLCNVLPSNYALCPSYHERLDWATARQWLLSGLNLSVVFDTEYCPQHDRIGELPDEYCGFPVIDGDVHDLRHPDFDGHGNIVGLRFKGSRRLLQQAIERGFVVSA